MFHCVHENKIKDTKGNITLLRGRRYNLKRINNGGVCLVGGLSKEAYVFTVEMEKFFKFLIHFHTNLLHF